jgi:hypothetical protein
MLISTESGKIGDSGVKKVKAPDQDFTGALTFRNSRATLE